MTGGQRWVAFSLACWLAAGCELTPFAETSALACTDQIENDGDGHKDCADSDCWAFAHCRVVAPDAGAPFVPEPPVKEPPVVPPPLVMDAAVAPPVPDASVVHDAAIADAGVDATKPHPCEACPEGPCIDGVCAPSEPLGRFRVVNLRAVVPISRELAALGSCFDTSLACDRFFGCCDPDPIITMRVDGAKVGSLRAENAADKSWRDPNFEFELRNGSKVEFELSDDDAVDPGETADPDPDLLFWCWTLVNADHVGAGELTCAPDEVLPSPILGASVSVTARIVAKPDATP